MSDEKIITHQDVIDGLQEEIAALKAERDAAFNEAHSLAVVMHRRYFHEVTQWKPLDYTAGLISQIDNMAAGLGLELDKAKAELARARGEIRQLWVAQAVRSGTALRDAIHYAENKYNREIAQQGEEGEG